MEPAARQHGVFSIDQALRHGYTYEQVRHHLAARRWRAVRRGVLAVVGASSSYEQSVMAAVLAAGDGAVASHFTAARLWGFPDVRSDVGVEVTTDRPDQRRLRGVRTHRTTTFLSIEHTTLHHIPVATVARTLVDCTCLMSIGQLGRALDRALRNDQTSLRAVRTCVSGLRPAPGRRPTLIQELLAKRLPGYEPGDSDSEVRLMRVIVEGGLPEPVLHHRVVVDATPYVPDLAYPDVKLAIEYDGYEVHNTRSAFDHDRRRANRLTAAGWRRVGPSCASPRRCPIRRSCESCDAPSSGWCRSWAHRPNYCTKRPRSWGGRGVERLDGGEEGVLPGPVPLEVVVAVAHRIDHPPEAVDPAREDRRHDAAGVVLLALDP